MFDSWVARPATRTTFATTDRRLVAIVLAVALTLAVSPLAPAPAEATTGAISGVAFQDLNRDGVHQPDDPGWEGHLFYLFDGEGNYLRNATSDANGRYSFSGLADGDYLVILATTSWREVRDDWVPTTTGSLRPQVRLSLSGTATADFGWRPIVRSTDVNDPISSLTGPSGIRIASYNDVITAEQIHDALLEGSLVGPEAKHTLIRHDLGTSTACSIAVGRSGGEYASYSADCHVSWNAWLTNPHRSLFHEYGHAWSMYHAYMTHQDADLTDYLEFRGLLDDDRLDSSHEWSRYEIIAEDYRQLFGSASGRAAPQENRDIPTAEEVPGLREFLGDDFTGPTEDAGSDDDAGADTDDDGTSDEGDPTDDPGESEEGEGQTDTVDDGAGHFVSPSSGDVVSGTIDMRLVVDVDDPAAASVVYTLGDVNVDARYHRGSGHHIAKVDTSAVEDGPATLRATVTHADGSVEAVEVEIEVANGADDGAKGGGNGRGGKK